MAGFTNRALQAKEKIFQTLLDLTVCHWSVIPTLRRILSLSPSMVISPSHSNIKKNIVSVTFNGNQSMNKISYLWLEWNPNSLVAKLTA